MVATKGGIEEHNPNCPFDVPSNVSNTVSLPMLAHETADAVIYSRKGSTTLLGTVLTGINCPSSTPNGLTRGGGTFCLVSALPQTNNLNIY